MINNRYRQHDVNLFRHADRCLSDEAIAETDMTPNAAARIITMIFSFI